MADRTAFSRKNANTILETRANEPTPVTAEPEVEYETITSSFGGGIDSDGTRAAMQRRKDVSAVKQAAASVPSTQNVGGRTAFSRKNANTILETRANNPEVEYETITSSFGGGISGTPSPAMQRRLDARAAEQAAANGDVTQSKTPSKFTTESSTFSAASVGSGATSDYTPIRQYISGASSQDSLRNLVPNEWKSDTPGRDPMMQSSTIQASNISSGRIPNPLRNHNTYNYIITLGVLNPREYNDPSTYRNRGDFASYIIKSSGGNYANRYKVQDEVNSASGGDAEYYIDDLEMDAVIAPNQNTGVALGTTLSFKVIEPFSMGNFIQALIGSAKSEGYVNYIDAPFCIRIDFVGWDEYGEQSTKYIGKPIYVPIKITKVELSVTGAGSEYIVVAVPFSETALDDSVNETKTTINAVGTTVWEVLNGNDTSVAETMNQRLANLEDKNVTTKNDRFIIAFPSDIDGFNNTVSREVVDEIDGLSKNIEIRQEQGVTPVLGNSTANTNKISVVPNSQLHERLQQYARDTSQMNSIGLSSIIDDISEGGDKAQATPEQAYNAETETFENTGRPGNNPTPKAREHKFSQGETIISMIEKVVLRSQYAAVESTADSAANGTRKWFKIDTQVFIDPDPSAELQRGALAKIYLFNVIPYYPDEAKTLSTNQKPKNTEQLKAQAAKEYNYIYTGRNEEILDFDLLFNNAFMLTAFSNYGQNSGGVGNADGAVKNGALAAPAGSSVVKQDSSDTSSEPGARVGEMTYKQAQLLSDNGSRSSDIRLRIAQQFHNAIINQTLDMITAEMKIMGDPFFIPQQTGNFKGNPIKNSNVLEEGTFNYMMDEVFIVVNFKTPFDYQVDGATMEFPRVVKQFSGLFSVWAVTNTFSGGKFEQNIKLIRRRGQDDPSTPNNAGSVVLDDNAKLSDAVVLSDTPGAPKKARPGQTPVTIPSYARADENLVNAVPADAVSPASNNITAQNNSVFPAPPDRENTLDDQQELSSAIRRVNINQGGAGRSFGGR